MFSKGHVFHGPDGQGYTLNGDVSEGDFITASQLAPFGGAPEGVAGEPLPNWLAKQVFSERYRGALK